MAIPILAGFARAAVSGAGRGLLGGATGSRTAGSLLSGFGDSFQRGGNQGANLLDGALRRAAETANNQFLPMVRDMLPMGLGRLAESTVHLTNVFTERGRQLERYSGVLSGTNAINDVKNIMADIKEARAMEDSLARISQSQNDIWLELRDILLPVKQLIAELVADGLDMTRDFIQFIKPMMERIVKAVEDNKSTAKATARAFFGLAGTAMSIWELMRDVEKNTRKQDEMKDVAKQMFEDMMDGALKGLNRNPLPIPQNDGGRLNLPAFGF